MKEIRKCLEVIPLDNLFEFNRMLSIYSDETLEIKYDRESILALFTEELEESLKLTYLYSKEVQDFLNNKVLNLNLKDLSTVLSLPTSDVLDLYKYGLFSLSNTDTYKSSLSYVDDLFSTVEIFSMLRDNNINSRKDMIRLTKEYKNNFYNKLSSSKIELISKSSKSTLDYFNKNNPTNNEFSSEELTKVFMFIQLLTVYLNKPFDFDSNTVNVIIEKMIPYFLNTMELNYVRSEDNPDVFKLCRNDFYIELNCFTAINDLFVNHVSKFKIPMINYTKKELDSKSKIKFDNNKIHEYLLKSSLDCDRTIYYLKYWQMYTVENFMDIFNTIEKEFN